MTEPRCKHGWIMPASQCPDCADIFRIEANIEGVDRLIIKAAGIIGTHPDLQSIACIDAALDRVEILRKELIEARAERDGYRNGQAQMQHIADCLQDTIKKYAAERVAMRELVDGATEVVEIWGETPYQLKWAREWVVKAKKVLG